MATYLSTIRFTHQGIQNIADTGKRANAFKAAAKKLDVRVKELYWTLGAFDGAIIFEAPDDETAAAAMLQLGMLGNVQTTTVRAFNAAEMGSILSKLSS